MSDKKEKKDKESPQSWWGLGVLVMVVMLVIGTWLLWPESKPPVKTADAAAAAPADYPLCANSPRREINVGGKAEIMLNSGCWSGWISLPDQVRARVRTLSLGDLEYKFWNGERVLVPNGAALYDVAKNIPESVFRLRGTGKAEISVERL